MKALRVKCSACSEVRGLINNFHHRFFQFSVNNDGWAESLQIHHDGVTDYLGFRMAELPRSVRWIPARRTRTHWACR
ncbi:hypothetical protein, partial [Mesorhizobium sp. M7A.F.Ca.ET.027.03.2.1]|uniref:hypothetical protein n=1 Tax=Mesorhizobium sp. M7A.F.Ca.ET.027.03.2.1 TaxID=2496656 RepID=UPI001AECB856